MRGLSSEIAILQLALILATSVPSLGKTANTLMEPVVVDSGLVFVHGQRLAPPFLFEVLSETTLVINEIVVCSHESVKPKAKPRASDVKLRQVATMVAAQEKMSRLRGAGYDNAEALDSVVIFLRGFPELFDSVRVDEGEHLWVWEKHTPYPVQLELSDQGMPSQRPTRIEMLSKLIHAWRSDLSSGGAIVIWACGGFLSVPQEQVQALRLEIDQARLMSPEAAGRERFKYLRPPAARQFATQAALKQGRGGSE